MRKQEFIDRLQAALNGRVAPGVLSDNVNFYEEYIDTEMRKGKQEEEILQALGDPRLIARTIIETYRKENAQEGAYQESDYDTGNYQEAGYASYDSGYRADTGSSPRSFHMQGWMWMVILLIVLVLVIGLVFSVVSFLLPIILPILVVLFFVKLFRDWLN